VTLRPTTTLIYTTKDEWCDGMVGRNSDGSVRIGLPKIGMFLDTKHPAAIAFANKCEKHKWSDDQEFEDALMEVFHTVQSKTKVTSDLAPQGFKVLRVSSHDGGPFVALDIDGSIRIGYKGLVALKTKHPAAIKFAQRVKSPAYRNKSDDYFDDEVEYVLRTIDNKNFNDTLTTHGIPLAASVTPIVVLATPTQRIQEYLDKVVAPVTKGDPNKQRNSIEVDRLVDESKRYIVYTTRQKPINRTAFGEPKVVTIYDAHVDNQHIGHIGLLNNRITDLKVFKPYRGKGYSRQLLSWLIDQKEPPLQLVARPSKEEGNIPLDKLISYYQSFGFVPTVKADPFSCLMVKLR